MGKRILIVDDSSIMRNMVKKTLKTEGHIIAGEAKNGREGVALYKSLLPDVVTMDITMREMDGLAAAREIMAYDKKAQIIFLSNLEEEKYGEDTRRIGAKGYVGKRESREILALIDSL